LIPIKTAGLRVFEARVFGEICMKFVYHFFQAFTFFEVSVPPLANHGWRRCFLKFDAFQLNNTLQTYVTHASTCFNLDKRFLMANRIVAVRFTFIFIPAFPLGKVTISRNQGENSGQLPPRKFTTFLIDRYNKSQPFCPPRKFQLVAALSRG